MAAGISPAQFWDLTYRELYALFAGAAQRRNHEYRLAAFQAWVTENQARTKRQRPLERFLRSFDPPRVMSPQALRGAVLSMAKSMGATVVRRRKGE